MKKLRLPEPESSLKGFHFSNLKQKEYLHFWLVLFWPVYYLRYFIVEALNPSSAGCYVMHCALDDRIPLCEYFLIPYALWMVCLLGMHLFLMVYDRETCKRYVTYLMVSITISTTVFILFPTCQELRPETMPRDNLFTRILALMYQMDTNTNVCPSEHVIGSMAILAAAINCKYLKKPLRLTVITILMVVISMSTVFLKQHSLLDVVAAMPVCLIAYLVSFPVSRRVRASEQGPALGTA